MATEIIQHQGLAIKGIYALQSWIAENALILGNYRSILHEITPKDLARISNMKTANQVLVVCSIPDHDLDIPQINNSLTLFLDDIQNPGNMGSILRIANWFGLPYVFCSNNCVEVYNSKVIQASMGAFLNVKTIRINFEELIKKVPDLPSFAAVLEGDNIFSTNLPKNGLLIIGNEGAGISKKIIEKTTHKISIPKGKNGGAESLNAAVATGIICAVLSGGVKV